MAIKTVRVEVTEDDIAYGVPNSEWCCPLANAWDRVYEGKRNVFVGANFATVIFKKVKVN